MEGSVEAVGLENNHTDDYGSTGKRTTKTALTEAGVVWFDAETPYILEKGGVRIAFLSIWQQWVFHYGKQYDATIAALKAEGINAVVVYIHSGEEYNPYHIEKQTSIPQVTFTFSGDGEYLGQQLRIYPANVSGDAENNDYQPRLVSGDAALAVYALIDQDSATADAPVLEIETDSYRDYRQVTDTGFDQ